MSRYTIEQFVGSDKYNIHAECFKDFWQNHQNGRPTDETHIILMLTVKHTVLQTLNLIKNGDCILETLTEMQSLLSCLEVKFDEHNPRTFLRQHRPKFDADR